MRATIRVKQCLANQQKLAGIDGARVKSMRYPGCQECETGALARAGELNDDDLQALLADYQARRQNRRTAECRTAEGQNMEPRNRRRQDCKMWN